MPRIFIAPTAHKHLKRIVSDAYNAKQATATFLDSELRRAVVSETLPKHVVTPGSLVRYQLDWGPFSPVRQLVYPGDFTNSDTQISLLSPIGIALLGLRRGDTMPVLVPGVGFQTLHVATVVYPELEAERFRHMTGH
jgi:transcription elongation GreA/GreB family factor